MRQKKLRVEIFCPIDFKGSWRARGLRDTKKSEPKILKFYSELVNQSGHGEDKRPPFFKIALKIISHRFRFIKV